MIYGAILIDFAAAYLTLLLIYKSIRYRVLYIKPFVGLGMFVAFGVILLGITQAQAVLGASEVPTLLISALGMLIGLGWVMEGLDRLKRGRR
jgi:hypothetical protein